MKWLMLLLPAIAAAVAGMFLMQQLDSRTIHLNTGGVSQETAGAYLGWARTEAPELWAATDAVLLHAGFGMCRGIEQMPGAAVTPRPVDGLTGRELHAIVDAATTHLCADQRRKVTGYLRDAR